jgi:hypothetical protein
MNNYITSRVIGLDPFYKRNLTGLKVLGTQVVKLEYDDGSFKVHSNTVWSVHKDVIEGVPLNSGMLHLFQNGAGAGFGYFGYHVSEATPITIYNIGVPVTTGNIGTVESILLSNMYLSKSELA